MTKPASVGKMILTVFNCQGCGAPQGCKNEASGEVTSCASLCKEKCTKTEKFHLFKQEEAVSCFSCQLKKAVEYPMVSFEEMLKN
jgi:hypothetical protein